MTVPASWQLLDLHNHTYRSFDAVNRPSHYERAYAEGRFHALAITDHNRIDGALELAERASFPVIVGMEVDTADGELIGLFLDAPPPVHLPALETAERIRAQGGLVYLQHPFYPLLRRPLRAGAREALAARGLVDVVEGLNGGPFSRRYDAQAQAWARSSGLPLGAGSDAHEPSGIGRCAVAVMPGEVDAASLPFLLRDSVLVDRRRNSLLQLGSKARHEVLGQIPAWLRGEAKRRL
jgi:predicted metal-dependent phosphoesterase TrpH